MERDVSAAERPGDVPRFLADTMLGRLATWLRILGYDAEYFRGADADLIARAERDGRILLTRDTGILLRRGVPSHVFIRDDRVMAQLRQVISACHLVPAPTAPRRCPRCNVILEPRTKAETAASSCGAATALSRGARPVDGFIGRAVIGSGWTRRFALCCQAAETGPSAALARLDTPCGVPGVRLTRPRVPPSGGWVTPPGVWALLSSLI